MKKTKLLNTYVNNLTWEETMKELAGLVECSRPASVVEVNVDLIMQMEKDAYFRKIVREADLTLVDGKPLIWISRWLRHPIKEKISGSDLMYRVCELAEKKNYSVFILGGKPETAKLAEENVRKRYPGISEIGSYSPPFGFEKKEEEKQKILDIVSKARPDFLMVCLGAPKQEKWIYENAAKSGAKVHLCAGASVDFMAGTVKRAPKWMSDHGFEWFYRFLMEPKRLFRRYFIDDVKILRLMWKYRGQRKETRE